VVAEPGAAGDCGRRGRFKDDDGEGNFIGDVKFADGTDPRVMRNRYAVLYNHAVEDLIQKDLKATACCWRARQRWARTASASCGAATTRQLLALNGLPTW